MASKGNGMKIRNGLTFKQNKFVNNIVRNVAKNGAANATEAALNVYDTTDKEVAKAIAGENLSKPSIREALDKAFRANGLLPDDLVPELQKLAQSNPNTVSADVKLRTIVEVLKLQGAYPTQKQPFSGQSTVINIQNISFGEAKDRIKELHGEMADIMNDTK